jgi:hypothetical protein
MFVSRGGMMPKEVEVMSEVILDKIVYDARRRKESLEKHPERFPKDFIAGSMSVINSILFWFDTDPGREEAKRCQRKLRTSSKNKPRKKDSRKAPRDGVLMSLAP